MISRIKVRAILQKRAIQGFHQFCCRGANNISDNEIEFDERSAQPEPGKLNWRSFEEAAVAIPSRRGTELKQGRRVVESLDSPVAIPSRRGTELKLSSQS